MTFEELALIHCDGDSPSYHAAVSIEYAISVLEDYKKELPPIPGVQRAHDFKIAELKALLTD